VDRWNRPLNNPSVGCRLGDVPVDSPNVPKSTSRRFRHFKQLLLPFIESFFFLTSKELLPHFERLVDSREAAALLQIHTKTLQRLARKGEIRALRIGKLWRFRTSDLDAWVHLRLKLASYPYRP
jgi:excisionase family DNA binding protein